MNAAEAKRNVKWAKEYPQKDFLLESIKATSLCGKESLEFSKPLTSLEVAFFMKEGYQVVQPQPAEEGSPLILPGKISWG